MGALSVLQRNLDTRTAWKIYVNKDNGSRGCGIDGSIYRKKDNTTLSCLQQSSGSDNPS